MAFEEKSRPQPVGEQAPGPDVFRQMLETLVQEWLAHGEVSLQTDANESKRNRKLRHPTARPDDD